MPDIPMNIKKPQILNYIRIVCDVYGVHDVDKSVHLKQKHGTTKQIKRYFLNCFLQCELSLPPTFTLITLPLL